MANLTYKDLQGNTKYIKAIGLGSDADPQIVIHQDPNVEGILDRLAITGVASEETLLEVLNVISSFTSETTATRNNLSATLVSQEILPANSSRKAVVIYNDSTVNILYLAIGETEGSITDYTYALQPEELYEIPNKFVKFRLTGRCSSEAGTIKVTFSG